jgi:hypothetical protein
VFAGDRDPARQPGQPAVKHRARHDEYEDRDKRHVVLDIQLKAEWGTSYFDFRLLPPSQSNRKSEDQKQQTYFTAETPVVRKNPFMLRVIRQARSPFKTEMRH